MVHGHKKKKKRRRRRVIAVSAGDTETQRTLEGKGYEKVGVYDTEKKKKKDTEYDS